VFIDASPGWGSTTPGMQISANELRWAFEDFEPQQENNISVAMVMPSAWMKVLVERQNVVRNPQDGEAWGRLAKLYKEMSRLRHGDTRPDPGGEELFQLSREAYQKAVTLLPEDALWHAGYADLLFEHYFWIENWQPQKSGLIEALKELDIAVQLRPFDPYIINLVEEVSYTLPEAVNGQGEEVVFLWLTVTPTLYPTEIPLATQTPPITPTLVQPSVTPTHSVSATSPPVTVTAEAVEVADNEPSQASEEDSSKSRFPLCSSAILPLLVVVFWIKRVR